MVLLALVLMSLLGFAAFAIDFGLWEVHRGQVQNAADAGALAGASALAQSQATAQSQALAEYAKNGQAADTVTEASTTYQSANDSVTVSASRSVKTWFSGIFGIHSVTVSGSARATIESFTQINGVNVMPWGVLQASYVPGQAYSVYTKTQTNANNGAISLPYVSGTSCPDPNGANAYSDEISGALQPCPASVGESVQTKPGDNSGPTAQGLNQRITTWKPVDQIVRVNADGTATVLDPTSPQLVIIPVLTDPSGQSQWPDGTSSPMTVVGFAWFVITSCGDPNNPTYCQNNDGKQVNGEFVTLASSQTMGTPGPYDPSSNTAYTVELTK